MMKFSTKLTAVLAVLLLAISGISIAQTAKWQDKGNNKNATFYQVQQNFNQYWQGRKIEKGKGYKPFKRWEAFMAPRVYPTGDMSLPSTTYANFMAWKKSNSLQRPVAGGANTILTTGNWTELGPIGSPAGPIGEAYTRTGAGRLNFVRFDPNNTNIMYVGAPDGGLWKSTNGGASWATNTDFLTIIGCSDLCIDPTNTQIMYLATGDLEGNRRSAGVLKSTDGGATWNTTGLSWAPTDNYRISKMLMNPSDPLNMIIATDGGIFRTTDGWVTNTNTYCCDNLKDMEFKPGDANTVYAAGQKFFKSTDNGVNWAEITTGLPSSSNISRYALGVTAGNSAYVYALIGKSTDQSFLGMYRSTNSGTSFSLRSSTPNLLAYETDGSDAGGQAFYDLAVAVSPTNPEIVTTGGINHWQSTDGGTTWNNLSFWASGEVHADIHEISYLPGSSTTMFSCNDGGIHKSTDNGNTFVDISNNLAISQVVGIGLSSNLSTTIVNGEQDNGTNLKTGSSWANINGGDGGECFIDPTNNNTIYIQYISGAFSRSDDGGATNNGITTGLPGGFDFYSQWFMDPVNPNRLYVGGIPTLYTSADKGDNWSPLGTPSGTGSIKGIAVAPSNTTIIYAIKDDAISRSTNSGTSFSNITSTLPVGSAALSSVAVSNTDANKVWVTFSGYSAGDKVFKSVNGGTSWTNVSTGLPNLPMNEVVYTNGSATDAIYIAGDIGVYYLDNTLASFAPFMTALPNVAVRDLEIFYPTGKLRAGTYGRGVWESDLYVADVVNYTITASAGANGAISPTGAVSVVSGANQTFTITPDACYQRATVLVDGVNNPAAVTSGSYTFTNVTAAHTISATFSQLTYNITASAGANGSISPNGATSVNCGANQTFTITPNACYAIANVIVDGVSQGAIGTYTFTNVTAAHTISATFSQLTYTITATSGANGTVTPAGATVVNCGANQTYTITPNTCYAVANVIVDGVSQGAITTYTFTNVTTAHTISATFLQLTYTITSSAGANGSISPNGATVVNCGANQTYTITPSGGFTVQNVLVDGVPQGAITTYTFTNVTAAHTISATFISGAFTINASAGANGSISPSGAISVTSGANQTFTITANSCYAIANVIVDGVSEGAIGTYTFTNVTTAHTISATFSQLSYTITATSGANGTVTPAGATVVNCGANQTYTIAANPCYQVANVVVDGVSQGAITTYTFTNVTAAHTISATFSQLSYTITATSGANGTVTPAGATVVNCGANQTYTITPNLLYTIQDVIVDGVSQGAITTYTFSNVTSAHTISANFALIAGSFTITASAGPNGTISPMGSVGVTIGANQTFNIAANSCYVIANVVVDGVSQGAIATYTFTNVIANHTISATFSQRTYNITASAGANGSITPAGVTSVNCGTNRTYAIIANSCYQVANVIVDGVSQGAISTYTFTNVTATHTISASFSLRTYTITATAGANGTVTPGGATVVNCGANQTYSITPAPGFAVQGVLVDGVAQGAITTYTFTNVTAAHTISATFTTATGCVKPTVALAVTNVKCKGSSTGAINLTTTGGSAPFTYAWTGPNSFTATTEDISGVKAGTYSVRVTATGGCYTIASCTITEPSKALSVTASAGTITCKGGKTNVVVTASGGTAPYTGTGTFTNQYAGTRTYTVTDSKGCTASKTIVIAAGTGTAPAAQTITGPASVTAGQTNVQYSVPCVSGQTYSWVVPQGATITSGVGTCTIKVRFGTSCANGYVKVTVCNPCGTAKQAIKYVSVNRPPVANAPVADNADLTQNDFRIYPNPVASTGSFTFSSLKANEKFTIKITTMNGKKVYEKSGVTIAGENKLPFNISGYVSGVYLVTLSVNNKTQTIQLVKGN